jgi:predicted DNA-binding transcriptional regulator AlpA
MPTKKLLREKDVHAEYGLSLAWLRKMRLFRQGPPYLKLNRLVVYRREEFEKWLDQHSVSTRRD